MRPLPRPLAFALAIFAFAAPVAAAPRKAPTEIIVASYNVENYVGKNPTPPAEGERRTRPKSERQIAALVRVIQDIRPDVLGICEMGGREQLADLQARLKAVGIALPESEWVDGPDPERHLALLSRFPIVARQSRPDVSYELGGQPEKVKRGILDVTVRVTPAYDLRLVGVHLKSKLPDPRGEALIRRNEAERLRAHLDAILTATPDTNLLAYGDFNDSKNEPAIQEVMGPRGSPTHMADLWAKDVHGDRWTHYWRTADEYSRIDFLFVSPALFREVVLSKSRVYRSETWNDASDHRPVYTSIRPVNLAPR